MKGDTVTISCEEYLTLRAVEEEAWRLTFVREYPELLHQLRVLHGIRVEERVNERTAQGVVDES